MRELIWKWLLLIFSPENLGRRQITPGFQRENLPVWGVLTALFIAYTVLVAGHTFNLYLPIEDDWDWQEVTFPYLGWFITVAGFLYASWKVIQSSGV